MSRDKTQQFSHKSMMAWEIQSSKIAPKMYLNVVYCV